MILLVIFVLCVIAILVIFPGIILTIFLPIVIITGVLAVIIIQPRELNLKTIIMFFNEKKLLLMLFFASIASKIFFINTQKTSPDIFRDIRTANLILQRGIIAYFTNYANLHHIGPQYPPLYPLLLAVIFPFGVTIDYVKGFTVVVGALLIIPTYFIGKELYDKRKAAISASIMFSLPLPFLMSLQGINDVLITFFSALFMYFFILYVKHGKISHGILAGVIMGIGVLFKYTIGVHYLSTLLFAVLYTRKKNNRAALSKTLLMILVSLLFIIPWIVYMYYSGLIAVQINKISALIQPGRKLGSDSGYETYWWFLFLLGSIIYLSPTNIFLLLLFIAHVVYRRKDNWKNILLLSWVIVPFLFYGFLHPLVRYWMISFPALTLLVANSIEDLNREQYRGKIFLTTFVCSVFLCFLISYISLIYMTPYLASHLIRELLNTYF